MKLVRLDEIIEGNTYYIECNFRGVIIKYKAVFDYYNKNNFYFKKIIRINTPKNWIGFIAIHEYMYHCIYTEEKMSIQTKMEQRAIDQILENITGTNIMFKL